MDKQAEKIIEYANYIRDHRENVMKAWKSLQEPCKSMNFIYDDCLYEAINWNIQLHDKSKYSQEEFIPYQLHFFPVDVQPIKETLDIDFANAWEHHKKHNRHHWQYIGIYGGIEDVVEMVCDWMAMGMQFGDTAENYYLKNQSSIILKEWQVEIIKEIFKLIR